MLQHLGLHRHQREDHVRHDQPAGDGEAAFGKARSGKMRGITNRAPVEHAFSHVRHVGERADQHRYLIVLIEIVGRQSGDRIDVGRAQPVWVLERCRWHARGGHESRVGMTLRWEDLRALKQQRKQAHA